MARDAIAALLILGLLGGCGSGERVAPDNADSSANTGKATFVGSSACSACHREQYELWRGSHHDLAMQVANADSVLGNFNGTRLTHFGAVTRFFRRGEEFWVETQNAQGKAEAFQIRYTFGVLPLQQYLVALPGGRFQALTVAWDSRSKQEGGQRWFHLQPDEAVPAMDPLHWTGPYYNWNSRCATCHSTGLRRNYDESRDQYTTSWAEINVACEACHGPGSQHLQWAAAPARTRGTDLGLRGADLRRISQWTRGSDEATAHAPAMTDQRPVPGRQLDVCGACHSRRQTLVGDDEVQQLPAYHDAYEVALPVPPVYYADGQIRDEDYELGSFMQSRMYARGVVCSNCHDPHSLQLRTTGNGVCAQCHNTALFDTPAHHHHEVGTRGAACVDCHMPETTYMTVDRRRDHSLRIPRPDLSAKSGTPNACNQCHKQQSAAWAAARIQQWQGSAGRQQATHFSEQLASGDRADWLRLGADEAAPGIARAAALSRLALQPGRDALTEASLRLSDEDPLVRSAAAALFESVAPAGRLANLEPLVADPVKAVRMQVARLLAATDLATLSPERRVAMSALFDEYLTAMQATGDLPGNQVSLGLFHNARRDGARAEAAYRQALRLDRHFVAAYLDLADLYRQQSREGEAYSTLRQALQSMPQAAAVHFALGLQRIRAKAYAEGIGYLRQAHELAPDDSGYGYVYAVALFDTGSQEAAIQVLRRITAAHPEDNRSQQALKDYLARRGRTATGAQ